MAAREVHSGGQVLMRALKTLGMAAAMLAVMWALMSSQGQRFFIHWGDQVVEVSPVEQAPKKDPYE
jgi:hypothetical protein